MGVALVERELVGVDVSRRQRVGDPRLQARHQRLHVGGEGLGLLGTGDVLDGRRHQPPHGVGQAPQLPLAPHHGGVDAGPVRSPGLVDVGLHEEDR